MTVFEESIVLAMRWLAEHAKIIVAPSGAVTTAAILEHSNALPTGTTASVASGSNIDWKTFVSLVGNDAAVRTAPGLSEGSGG